MTLLTHMTYLTPLPFKAAKVFENVELGKSGNVVVRRLIVPFK